MQNKQTKKATFAPFYVHPFGVSKKDHTIPPLLYYSEMGQVGIFATLLIKRFNDL